MKKILIVDDSAFMRSILKELIAQSSIFDASQKDSIFEADGKTNALEVFRTNRPDVILIDIVMRESEFEGIEFLEAIKSDFMLNKVIVISSVGQDSVIKRCKDLGVIYYSQKPFIEKEILDAVNNVLALREHTE